MRLQKALLFLFFVSISIWSLQARNLDSLEQALSTKISGNDYIEQLEAYFDLGKASLDEHNTEKALEYLLAAEALAKKLNRNDTRSEIQYEIGNAYVMRQEYQKAIEVLSEVVKDISAKGGKPLASAYYKLAQAYQTIGNNELAFEYHFKALKIREASEDRKGIAQSLYQIGGVHFFQGNLLKSIEYYEKCLEIGDELDNSTIKLSSLGAIGAAYSRLGRVEESLKFNLEAYDIAKSVGNKVGLAYITFNLGDDYQVLGEYEKALKYIEQSHEIKQELNDKWGQIGSTKAIGEIYIAKGDYKAGIDYIRKSLNIAQTLGAKPRLLEVYESLAKNLETIGDYKEANQYYRKFFVLKDSLVNEQTLQKMSDTKLKHEVEKREIEVERRDAQLSNMYSYLIWGGFFFLSLIFWQLFQKYKTQETNNRLQREKNQKIQQQNEELEQAHLKQLETNKLLTNQNNQITEQNSKLELKNEELQRFAYIASHDLKEPLRNIGSFATLLKRRFHGKMGEDADEYINFITTNVSRMYALLHEVLMFSKLDNEEIELEWVDLNEIVDTVQETLKGKIMEQNVQVVSERLPKLKVHQAHMTQLFQNILSNSIKYNNKEHPTVEVGHTIGKNDEFVFYIKDNGIGIDMEFKDRIFEIFKRLHGKNEYEGTGVGLAICKKIVNQYGGRIWIESEVGEGATFYFTLPVVERMDADKREVVPFTTEAPIA